jgi:hypothetical protein
MASNPEESLKLEDEKSPFLPKIISMLWFFGTVFENWVLNSLFHKNLLGN